MPTLVLGPLLTGASPADNTWTQTSKTPPQRAVQAAGVPTPSEVLAAAYHTALWLETKTIDQLVQQGTFLLCKEDCASGNSRRILHLSMFVSLSELS